ncbi:MAG TPA: hypothetical protein VH518_09700 [Tepidisphaeraceae bacterium]
MSTMLEFDEVHLHRWSSTDLREMLQHQLAAPMHLSLGTLSAEVSHQIRTIRPALNPLMTLGQLLRHEKPPVQLLKLVKRFAKICRGDPENPLPSEIVMLLYYTSITVALVRLNQSISRLSPESLERGLRWLSAQPWLTEDLRPLLLEGLAHRGSQGESKV